MSDNTNEKTHDNIIVEGILELTKKNAGQLVNSKKNLKALPKDPFIPAELVKRFKLRRGSYIVGQIGANCQPNNLKVHFIDTVDGMSLIDRKAQLDFSDLTTIAPEKQLKLETKDGNMSNRMIDLFCPIGKGQRGLIVAPPRTGKTTLLKDIAKGVAENHPECHIIVLLIDERPEEVTDFKRTVNAEIYASSNDEALENHVRLAEITIERAKRLMEAGKDVVLLLDSITRLSRVYNSARSSGRTMSGGLDVRALEKPRQIFSAARNTEESGSLTIIATALVETGSRMDELIFQEFKGTGNMELVLDRRVAEMRLWPAINITSSGTRREELLLDADTLKKSHFFRRALSSMKTDEATETAISRLEKTKSNKEFLNLISC